MARWPGTWRAVCQVCGFEFASDEIKKRWDGLLVCSKDYETRHPQTLIKIREESSVPAFVSSEPEDVFVHFCDIFDSSSYVGMAEAGCARASVISPTYETLLDLSTNGHETVALPTEPEVPEVTIANLVAELTASNYVSSQTFSNEVTTPADGSGQSAYDYYLGSSNGDTAGDPEHLGTYWNFRGGDFFTLASGATSTTFLKNMHKAGAKFTIELWLLYSGTGSGIRPMFDSGTDDHGGADTSRGVMYLDLGETETPRGHSIRVKRDSAAANALAKTTDSLPSTGAIHMLAISIDSTGASNSFFYKDGAYDPSGGVNTWDGTYSTPGTSDTTQPSRIGARGDALEAAPGSSRLYLLRLYNTNLTKEQLDANWTSTRSIFGI